MRSASTTGGTGGKGGSTRLPANIAPRCLTRAQAAEYCGCDTVEAFDGWVRKGIVPGPIVGTHRWDRRAIDRALDRRSGLLSDATQSIDEWLAENAS